MTRMDVAVAFVALSWCGSAFAEGSCPPGYYPIGGGGAVGCAPMPGGTDSVAGADRGYWADRYASVVFAREQDGTPTLTYSVKAIDQVSADAEAMEGCRHRGYLDCRIGIQFANGYFAVVRAADKSLYVASDFQADKARKIAKEQCKEAGSKGCKVLGATNSRADWIGVR